MTDSLTLRRFVRALSARGGAPAVIAVAADGETAAASWSFADLADRTSRAAAALVRAGLRRGEAVAILGPNRPEWVAAALATLEAGGAVMPIDPQLDAASIARILDAGACRFAFATTAAAPRFAGRTVFL